MSTKYNRIGIGYNETRKADPYLLSRLHDLLQPRNNGKYMDIGCGTGNYTVALYQKGINLVGVDPSDHMLNIARSVCPDIEWRQGTATEHHCTSRSMDGVVASLTIHHWPDIEEGMRALYECIKPGGRIVIFTSTSEQMEGYWLKHYFPQMLADSIIQMPAWNEIESAFLKSGFINLEIEKYFIQPDLQDLFLYAGKDRPNLYLDENVRRGISSFSDLSRKEEIEKGLKMLEDDLKRKTWESCAQKYANDKGDYLFIAGHRPLME